MDVIDVIGKVPAKEWNGSIHQEIKSNGKKWKKNCFVCRTSVSMPFNLATGRQEDHAMAKRLSFVANNFKGVGSLRIFNVKNNNIRVAVAHKKDFERWQNIKSK